MKTHRAGKLSLLLRDLFPSDQYTHVTEFRHIHNDRLRRVDQIAWGHHISTGHQINAFEIKTSRNDLRNELRDVEKWHAAREFCDRFYLVVGDAEMNVAGVPAEWGIIVPQGETLAITRTAARLRPPMLPLPPVDRGLVAAFLSRVRDESDREAKHVKLKERAAEDRGHRNGFNEARRMYRKKDRELIA